MWRAQISVHNDMVEPWVEGGGEGDEYCYYLYNIANVVVEKSRWVKKTSYVFHVEKEDIYYVKIFTKSRGKKESICTEYVDYYSQQTRSEFEKFCNEKREYSFINGLNPQYFYKMRYPYKDFAVIIDEPEICESFLDEYIFTKKNIVIGKHFVQLLCEKNKYDLLYSKLLFSGIAKSKKEFIFGDNDIEFSTKISDNNIGNFTYAKVEGRKIQISNDYFGTGKIYYFIDDNKYIFTNNYHLLLLLIKQLDIPVELNYSLILALLCKSGQAFQQSISREREIRNAFMLPIDKRIEINERGVWFKRKPIASVLNIRRKRSIKSLNRLIVKGKKEILDNTEMILLDKRYNKILVDLTGGLDSRLVYGSVGHFKEYLNKIVIQLYSFDPDICERIYENDSSDVATAIKLNKCLYDYKYNNVATDYLGMDLDIAENRMMSLGVMSGYFYPYSTVQMAVVEKDMEPTIELNGFYGEICCRPYYIRRLLEQKEKYESMDTLLSAIANRKGVLSGSTYNALKDKLKKEIQMLPGQSLLEKWENHYLFYRNGLHCNTIWECDKKRPQWGPLQSKALFKYKHLTLGNKAGIEEQLGVLWEMDRRLNLIPYADTNDEQERIDFLKSYENSNSIEISAEKFAKAKSEWVICRKEMSSTEVQCNTDMKSVWSENLKRYDETFERRMKELLHKLMNYNKGEFKDVFGIAVFSSLKQKRLSNEEMRTLYQKLVAVYVHVQLLKGKGE